MKKPCKTVGGSIGDAFICVAVDEETDSMGRFIMNPVAGKLNTEVPSNLHSICSKVLYCKNYSTVATFVNDTLNVLWPTGVHSDAAA
jgi:hypothetical protein